MKAIAVYNTIYLVIQVHGWIEAKLHATLNSEMEGVESLALSVEKAASLFLDKMSAGL